jgi:hypothetical protein
MAATNYETIYGLVADIKPDIGRVHRATAVALATFHDAAARDADGHFVIYKTNGTIVDMRARRKLGAAMDHVAEGLGFTPSSEAGHLALTMLSIVHDTWAETSGNSRWNPPPGWMDNSKIVYSGVGYPVFANAMATAEAYVYLRRNMISAIGPMADIVTDYLWAPVNRTPVREATGNMIMMSPFMRFFTAKYHTEPGPYVEDMIATLRERHPSLLASARQEIDAFIEARRMPNGRLRTSSKLVGPEITACHFPETDTNGRFEDKVMRWRVECHAPSRLKHFMRIWGW